MTTIHLFVLQILNGNAACATLPHLAQERFTPSAYCQARARLPLKIFQKLLSDVGQALEAVTDGADRWLGHRVFVLDGSSFSMPDTPQLQKKFGQPGAQKPGCGFPVAHLLLLFHVGTALLRGVLAAPLRTHDMSQVAAMHPELEPGDVLVGDRALCSFAHLALIFRQKLSRRAGIPRAPAATRGLPAAPAASSAGPGQGARGRAALALARETRRARSIPARRDGSSRSSARIG